MYANRPATYNFNVFIRIYVKFSTKNILSYVIVLRFEPQSEKNLSFNYLNYSPITALFNGFVHLIQKTFFFFYKKNSCQFKESWK